MNTDTHSFWEPQFRPAPKTHLELLCKTLHIVFLRKRDTTARMIRTRNESHWHDGFSLESRQQYK
jgi:hypothetical protein